ncbi:MAG TPA: glycine zipper 2TM domain-containing protein [Usitatibacter sp.]|nr:glycine zipper 2TM domain-containing protein [Usitatibacter sp.]
MKMHITKIIAAAALAAAPLASHALGTNEKGCLVGGAAGGVAGHTLGSGNHTLLGAAIGCGAGVLVNKERVKRVDAKEREKKLAAKKQRERVAQRDNRDLTPLR